VQPSAIGNILAFELSKVTLETGETSTARAKYYCFIAFDQELLLMRLRTRLLALKTRVLVYGSIARNRTGVSRVTIWRPLPLDDDEHAGFNMYF
jgi:hypothetical protein